MTLGNWQGGALFPSPGDPTEVGPQRRTGRRTIPRTAWGSWVRAGILPLAPVAHPTPARYTEACGLRRGRGSARASQLTTPRVGPEERPFVSCSVSPVREGGCKVSPHSQALSGKETAPTGHLHRVAREQGWKWAASGLRYVGGLSSCLLQRVWQGRRA